MEIPIDVIIFEVVPRIKDEKTLGALMLACLSGRLTSDERMQKCVRYWLSRNTTLLWAVCNARRGIDTSFDNMVALYGDKGHDQCMLQQALRACVERPDPDGYASLLRLGAEFNRTFLLNSIAFDIGHSDDSVDDQLPFHYSHPAVVEAFFATNDDGSTRKKELDFLMNRACLQCKRDISAYR